MARDTASALRRIVGVLRNHGIRFQISGGLAARIYGSRRQLADIDIEIPDAAFRKVLPDLGKSVVYGPRRYRDRSWDILLVTLRYGGQEIDLCGCDSERIYDRRAGRWRKQKIDLGRAVRKRAYGLVLPVVPLDDLIGYKKLLRRRVDLRDLRELEGKPNDAVAASRPS